MKRLSIPTLFIGLLFGTVASVSAFNSDGKPDIVFSDFSQGTNDCWFMNNATRQSEGALAAVGAGNVWKLITTADFNNDGQLDLIWFNTSTTEVGIWYMTNSTRLSTSVLSTAPGGSWQLVGAGYFSGITDNHVDLLWRDSVTGYIGIWLMNGETRTNTVTITSNPGLDWRIAGTGDFNHDGYTDILWKYYGTGADLGHAAIWYMNGTTYSASAYVLDSAGNPISVTGYTLFGTADFDGDGKLDFLWRYDADSSYYLWYMDNNIWKSSASLNPLYGPATSAVGAIGDSAYDSDHDGLPDLWERNNFGNLSQGANDDPDGDGYTNLQEYQMGTNPNEPELRVIITDPGNGSLIP